MPCGGETRGKGSERHYFNKRLTEDIGGIWLDVGCYKRRYPKQQASAGVAS